MTSVRAIMLAMLIVCLMPSFSFAQYPEPAFVLGSRSIGIRNADRQEVELNLLNSLEDEGIQIIERRPRLARGEEPTFGQLDLAVRGGAQRLRQQTGRASTDGLERLVRLPDILSPDRGRRQSGRRLEQALRQIRTSQVRQTVTFGGTVTITAKFHRPDGTLVIIQGASSGSYNEEQASRFDTIGYSNTISRYGNRAETFVSIALYNLALRDFINNLRAERAKF